MDKRADPRLSLHKNWWSAAVRGDTAALTNLQKMGGLPSAALGEALRWATLACQPRAVQWMLHQGADINAADAYGRTATHWAAYMGHLPVLQLLLRQGADALRCDAVGGGYTPLELAAWRGRRDVVAWLCREAEGTRADLVTLMLRLLHTRPVLPLAAAAGRHGVVELLLQLGVHADQPDHQGKSALWHASERRHVSVRSLSRVCRPMSIRLPTTTAHHRHGHHTHPSQPDACSPPTNRACDR